MADSPVVYNALEAELDIYNNLSPSRRTENAFEIETRTITTNGHN